MMRKKVKMAFITNDLARQVMLKMRKKELMKKVSELSTLCGIDACAIIYDPYGSQPEVWPSRVGAQRVLAQFKMMPEVEQSKKMVNQEEFIRERITKVSKKMEKLHKEIMKKEITEVMYQCLTGKELHNLILTDLDYLAFFLDQNMKEITKRIEDLKKATPAVFLPATTAPEAVVARQQPHDMEFDLGQFAEWIMSDNTSDHHQQMGF